MIDIEQANADLGKSEAKDIIEWAVNAVKKPMITTHFGPFEAVILHMVTQAKPDIPVIWIDSGYNTRETYKVAQNLIESLQLNLDVYTPKMTAARWDNVHGGVPDVGEEQHDKFTEDFKLEPFSRAMREQGADVWLTSVRSEQTEFRQNMEIFGTGPNGIVKVAPLLHWKEAEMQQYLQEHDLPNVENYFDPTKGLANRECGIHTKL